MRGIAERRSGPVRRPVHGRRLCVRAELCSWSKTTRNSGRRFGPAAQPAPGARAPCAFHSFPPMQAALQPKNTCMPAPRHFKNDARRVYILPFPSTPWVTALPGSVLRSAETYMNHMNVVSVHHARNKACLVFSFYAYPPPVAFLQPSSVECRGELDALSGWLVANQRRTHCAAGNL